MPPPTGGACLFSYPSSLLLALAFFGGIMFEADELKGKPFRQDNPGGGEEAVSENYEQECEW